MKIAKKQAKLEKQNLPQKKVTDKVKRGDYKVYLAWLSNQPLQCLECGTLHNIELHHVDSQDDRTCVPFCSYCHRGDNKDNKMIVRYERPSDYHNSVFVATKGFYLHRGTESRVFNTKWSKNTLMIIADRLYSEYKSQI